MAASLLVLGLVAAVPSRAVAHGAAAGVAPSLGLAGTAMAVLLTLAVLVWVTRRCRQARYVRRPPAPVILVSVLVLGLALRQALIPSSPRALAVAVVHTLRPCVRAVNATNALLEQPSARSSAIAQAVADQRAACDAAQRWFTLMVALRTNGGAAGLTTFTLGRTVLGYAGTLTADWQCAPSCAGGDLLGATQDDQFMFGSEMENLALSAADDVHVRPACVVAALYAATYGAGCRRVPAILH